MDDSDSPPLGLQAPVPLHPLRVCKFLLFRLLSVLTWTKAACREWAALPPLPCPPHTLLLGTVLGHLWDSTITKPHQLRDLVHVWVLWAGKANLRIAEAWSSLSSTESLSLIRQARSAGLLRARTTPTDSDSGSSCPPSPPSEDYSDSD